MNNFAFLEHVTRRVWIERDDHVIREPAETDLQIVFVNVGQGDCTLVLAHGAQLLFDAGHSGDRRRVGAVLDRHRVRGLDLMVGTHYDADHLNGLRHVIRILHGRVRFALVPPVAHPAPGLGSPSGAGYLERWAANRWRLRGVDSRSLLAHELNGTDASLAHVLAAADEPLGRASHEARAVLSRLTEQLRGLSPASFAEAAANRPDDGDDSTVFDDVERPHILNELLPDLERMQLTSLTTLTKAALDLGLARDPRAPRRSWSAALAVGDASERAVVRAVKSTVANAIVARWLNLLIRELECWRIDWGVGLAHDEAQWLDGPLQLAQLAPHFSLVERHVTLIPTLERHPLKVALETAALRTDQPTPSNQLSYVFALRDGDGRPGALLTGDTGLRDIPEAAKQRISECTLLDVPHHGGRWGDFGPLIVETHRGRWDHVDLYSSVRTQGSSPPREHVQQLRRSLVRYHRSVRTFYANRPAKSSIGCTESLPRRAGPDALHFVADASRFDQLACDPILCRC
jgi:hypothetical protein